MLFRYLRRKHVEAITSVEPERVSIDPHYLILSLRRELTDHYLQTLRVTKNIKPQTNKDCDDLHDYAVRWLNDLERIGDLESPVVRDMIDRYMDSWKKTISERMGRR